MLGKKQCAVAGAQKRKRTVRTLAEPIGSIKTVAVAIRPEPAISSEEVALLLQWCADLLDAPDPEAGE